jgi:SAM-dependent methyltransferase
MSAALVDRAKRLIGPRRTAGLRRLIRGFERPRWGNLRRTSPFSSNFGFERGTPVDRYYLHRFLDAHRALIAGHVLEVQADSYTRRYGHDLARVDTFDIVGDFDPTYRCDLARADRVIPTAAYDCVLLPNTLQHVRDLDAALRQLWRILRPGGAILASCAGLLPLTGDVADYWRLSPDGWQTTLQAAWPSAGLVIQGHGNCLATLAAQLGLALEELTDAELNVHDARFPVLTTILAQAR